MKISRLKIQSFRTIDRGFDCSLRDLNILVGRNNAGKSCAVRALNLFFNHHSDPQAFEPHVRVNPETVRKKRCSIIIGVWLSGVPDALRRKYRIYMTSDGQLPIRLHYAPKDGQITYKCFTKGRFSTRKEAGDLVESIIDDCSKYISLRVVPETRDLERELRTELGHGFKALKNAALQSAESRKNTKAIEYKKVVESLVDEQIVRRINDNLGNIVPGNSISVGRIDAAAFTRIVLSSLIDKIPFSVESNDSEDVLIEQMGAGFQGAVLVSLYRTVAQLEERKLILCVEEPEIHLDSHSQRYCYHHWKSQANEDNDLNQVLITSHSAFLVDEAQPDELVLVRRGAKNRTIATQLSEGFLASVDVMKLATKTLGLHNTDIFFSSFVVLVEGEGDVVGLRGFMEIFLRHQRSKYASLSSAGITFIECGGKDGIRALAAFIADIGIPYVVIFDRDVVQCVDGANQWKIEQNRVEKTFLRKLSNDFSHQKSLFSSDASFSRVSSQLLAAFKGGIQHGFPQNINTILSNEGIFVMRTEHESDMVDSRNFLIVAKQFDYDLNMFELGLETQEVVISKLKALNKKDIKRAFITAKIVLATPSWAEVPGVYAKMCALIYKKIVDSGVKL